MLAAEYSLRYSEVLAEIKWRHRHRLFDGPFIERAVRDSYIESATTAGWIEAADTLVGKRALAFVNSPSIAAIDPNAEPHS